MSSRVGEKSDYQSVFECINLKALEFTLAVLVVVVSLRYQLVNKFFDHAYNYSFYTSPPKNCGDNEQYIHQSIYNFDRYKTAWP